MVIAQALKKAEPTEAEHEQGTPTRTWTLVIQAMEIALLAENPKFNVEKFEDVVYGSVRVK